MALWDFSDSAMTFDQPIYLFDGSYSIPIVPPFVAMPNVVGLDYENALAMLQTDGVIVPSSIGYFGTYPVTAIWQESNQAPGIVLAQQAAAGAAVLPNQSITLTISQFPVAVAFP